MRGLRDARPWHALSSALAPVLAATLLLPSCAARFPRTIPQPAKLRSPAAGQGDRVGWTDLWRFEGEVVAVVVEAMPVEAAGKNGIAKRHGRNRSASLGTVAGWLRSTGERSLELRVEDRAIWTLVESEGVQEVVLRGGPRIRPSSVRKHADGWILVLSRSDVRQVSRQCNHHGARGALLGAAGGFAAVFFVTPAMARFEGGEQLTFQLFFGSLAGALPGALIGYTVGSGFGAKWCRLYQHSSSGNP